MQIREGLIERLEQIESGSGLTTEKVMALLDETLLKIIKVAALEIYKPGVLSEEMFIDLRIDEWFEMAEEDA